MFPAKFGFDPTATVSLLNGNCTSDFIVFPVNVTGSGTQPNIVGFNNLYSGTVGGLGICNAPANGRTVSANDDGVSATTIWSYNVTAAGGVVATSPALSIDGTKVAFVETGSGTTAHFHVLAWKSGDGVATNLQNVLLPVSPGAAVLAPVAGSGTVTDLALTPLSGTASDTLSSPFVEYNTDTAYIGNDSGTLFRVKDVFCPITVPVINPACSGLTPPAPSLDPSWGSGIGLVTGCPGKLTGPVVGGTGNIYVGCSDGKLYAFTSSGIPLTPLAVGDGSLHGGIVDPPLVDVVNGFVYVVSMSGSITLGVTAGTPVLVQAKTDLTSPIAATLGAGAPFNLHAPAFNDAYLSGGGTPLLYEVAGSTAAGGEFTLYGVGFTSFPVMNSGTPTNATNFIFGAFEISPLTQFLTSGGEDRLFESTVGTGASLASLFNITAFPAGVEHVVSEGTGTTGIVVDNGSASSQADSIYFGVLGSNTAVKLTQSALQ